MTASASRSWILFSWSLRPCFPLPVGACECWRLKPRSSLTGRIRKVTDDS
ncbi:transcriptional adaptor 3 [Phyllostomus discolor]|uniref:Transcriptional adaptor 3 n=1 Tax=Phyllostomus discolor TaxID=89673 RepID=A0A834E2K8_9CHIR|nr:transcriptional adaptor 3 [Phyllostomus discolor]